LFSDLSLDLHAGERLGRSGRTAPANQPLEIYSPAAMSRMPAHARCGGGTRVGYLAQDDRFPPDLTVHDVTVAALAEEPMEDYERETQAAITLTQVGFTDFEQKAEHLSGGGAKRLSLAQ